MVNESRTLLKSCSIHDTLYHIFHHFASVNYFEIYVRMLLLSKNEKLVGKALSNFFYFGEVQNNIVEECYAPE